MAGCVDGDSPQHSALSLALAGFVALCSALSFHCNPLLEQSSGDLMSDKSNIYAGLTRPAAVAFGAVMLAVSVTPSADAAVNPFVANALANGYGQVNMQNVGDATKSAEGLCGNHEGKPQQCEGKCGDHKAGKKLCKCKDAEDKSGVKKSAAEQSVTEKAAEASKCAEGKCGSH